MLNSNADESKDDDGELEILPVTQEKP